MTRIDDVLSARKNGRILFEEIKERKSCEIFCTDEIYSGRDPVNLLASADNLKFMCYLLKKRGMAGKIQLIYVDPPFFTNSRYQASVRLESERLGKSPVIKTGAYDDRWEDSIDQYLTMLAVRFHMMRELLSDKGCIWVHLDWHGSHYVKMLMDEIFGEKNFINEVAWTYKSGGASKRSFARKHDTLLFYSKTDKYKFIPLKEKSYNRALKPYRFKGVEEFQDETGWYTMVNMKDVWSIDMVGRTSAERTGYATQKPEKLLERIIASCSEEGDICADFFSGSGTLGVVSGKMNRRWIMCDEGDVSTAGQILRLSKVGAEAFAVLRSERDSRAIGLTNGSVEFSGDLGCLRMTAYKPDTFRLSANDETIAVEYISDDGISAVNFWSLDKNYDGKIHRSSKIVKKGDFCTFERGKESRRIHVCGYDVFGNRFQWQKKV